MVLIQKMVLLHVSLTFFVFLQRNKEILTALNYSLPQQTPHPPPLSLILALRLVFSPVPDRKP